MSFLNQKFKIAFLTVNLIALFLVCTPSIYAGDKDKDRDKDASLKKLEVHLIHDLHFGRVIMENGSRGSITINPVNGIKTLQGGVFNARGQHGSAEYEIHGEPDKRFMVIFPGDLKLWGDKRNNVKPKVSQFTGFIPNSYKWVGDTRIIGKFGQNGKARLLVGGTLNIPPNHKDGLMTGRSHIHVRYLY